MSYPFEIIKAYYDNPYMGWTTKEPKKGLYQKAYFLKVDGYYFMVGDPGTNNYHVYEEEE
jgi:hypothetical protein